MGIRIRIFRIALSESLSTSPCDFHFSLNNEGHFCLKPGGCGDLRRKCGLHDELIGKEYHSHGFNPGTFSTDDQAVQYAKELKQFIDSGMDDNQMPSKKPDYLGKLNFEKGDEAPDSINIEYDSHERDQDGRIHHYRGESVVSAITHNNGGALDLNCNDQIDVLAGGWRGRDGEEEEDHFGADFYYLDLDERGIPRDWIINKWTDHDETSDGEWLWLRGGNPGARPADRG